MTAENRATERIESTRKLGELMRDIYLTNPGNFRLFCPDETNSTGWARSSRRPTAPLWSASTSPTRRSAPTAG